MASCINVSHADIAILIEASGSKEVFKYEKRTSDGIENESSDNDFDTNNQQMNYKKRVFSPRIVKKEEAESTSTLFSIE
ncbi:hypothetical protein TNCV_4374791 [Trichonephila clavipes]|uniref:Uncharacterized protein n=1 Tax=Trichonephila clavipes TaxID=2585209 RepID=A0A8X7BCR1_TRICX|nr:hypothetical protein TNCV_4374791 [Trichonephila clavipes]